MPPSNDTFRVLVVEDDLSLREAVTQIFRRWGHDTTPACDGQDAWEILQSDRGFDVVLCDLDMPRMNGRRLFENVRETFPGLAPCFLFCSGGSENEAWALTSGQPFIKKPYNLDQVKEVVGVMKGDGLRKC